MLVNIKRRSQKTKQNEPQSNGREKEDPRFSGSFPFEVLLPLIKFLSSEPDVRNKGSALPVSAPHDNTRQVEIL